MAGRKKTKQPSPEQMQQLQQLQQSRGIDVRLIFAAIIAVVAVGGQLLQLQASAQSLPAAVELAARAGRYENFRGHAVFVADSGGAGEPTLLLHGFPTSSADWQPLWEDLRRGGQRRLLAPDFLGFGLSDKPFNHSYSILEQADLVEHVVAAAGLPRGAPVRVVAHDYGDTVAQELLARHLDGALGFELRSVALLNGGLFPEVHRPLLIQQLLLHPMAGPAVRSLSSAWLFKLNLGKTLGPAAERRLDGWLDDAWRVYQWKSGHMLADKLVRYMPERNRHRERWVGALQRAAEAGLPLRFINGPSDVISGAHMADRYREVLGDAADVVSLDLWIGHYPQVEDPDGVLAALAGFA